MGRVDVGLEEFKALRAELVSRVQAETTILSIALTATAVIAGFAFGGEGSNAEDRLEILLALPIVLCGLGLSYLRLGQGSVEIGNYIRDCLWPQLQRARPDSDNSGGAVDALPSWEVAVSQGRGLSWRVAFTTRGNLSWLPGFFIFGIPSLAALILNWKHAPSCLPAGAEGGDLQTAWLLDAAVVIMSGVVLVFAGRSRQTVNCGYLASSGPCAAAESTEAADGPT